MQSAQAELGGLPRAQSPESRDDGQEPTIVGNFLAEPPGGVADVADGRHILGRREAVAERMKRSLAVRFMPAKARRRPP
jgi:hypothetical protein